MKPVLEIYVNSELIRVVPETEYTMQTARSWATQNYPNSTVYVVPSLRTE